MLFYINFQPFKDNFLEGDKLKRIVSTNCIFVNKRQIQITRKKSKKLGYGTLMIVHIFYGKYRNYQEIYLEMVYDGNITLTVSLIFVFYLVSSLN